MNTRRSLTDTVFHVLSNYSLLILLIIEIVVFSIAVDGFLTVDNLRSIAVNEITTLFVALSLCGVLIVGKLDLSVASILSASQALTVGLMSFHGVPVPLAVLCGLGIGVVAGAINGLLVVRLRLDSLIVTLGMSSVLSGLVFWYTKGTSIFKDVPLSYQRISNTAIAGIPMPIIYGVIALVVFELVLRYLPSGRRLYAIGGNERAARLSGIRVDRLILLSFVAAGLVAAIGGVIISARPGSAAPDLGPSYLLPAFAAAFLGATTVTPGRYNALGTAIAVYVLAVLISGIQQLGAPTWASQVFNGVALILGVAAAYRLVKLREARARRDQLRSFAEGPETIAGGAVR